ncbi:hypothetical protein G7Y89_g2555 [Cudoniella acicularis]|uniref:FAD-binding FR-type domain-containing protein n=1 Tax=Cudoniella acicularis TaxID=354080 RepID=A0A8H4RT52_9HELO|nr:hypothetical protein G7Y89_g2555 [Cudoniella acicularis]
MVLICRRIHFYEINDQTWFPQYLREKVQSCLTLCWTFRVPVLQKASPAQLVASTLCQTLSDDVRKYTYVDFCAGAGGPTPFIEKDLNAQLSSRMPTSPFPVNSNSNSKGLIPRSPRIQTPSEQGAVKFVLTDLHPHIPDWTEASKKSENLSFVADSVDAANAPSSLNHGDGREIFRLYNLAFHHFEDKLGLNILRNTIETADGFGIFELQERTISSLITMFAMGGLMLLITPFYFWRSPGHLFFTYIIPIIPFVLVFDGIISSLRTRSAEEVQALMKECGASCDGWTVKSGQEQHTWPTGNASKGLLSIAISTLPFKQVQLPDIHDRPSCRRIVAIEYHGFESSTTSDNNHNCNSSTWADTRWSDTTYLHNTTITNAISVIARAANSKAQILGLAQADCISYIRVPTPQHAETGCPQDFVRAKFGFDIPSAGNRPEITDNEVLDTTRRDQEIIKSPVEDSWQRLSDVLYGTLGLIAILVFTVRIAHVSNGYIRLLVTLNLDSEQQAYWKHAGNFWSKVKKNFLIAPLFRRRHNKELQLSTAINVGTLPSRLHTFFLSFYVLSNLIYCCLLDYHGQPRAALLAEARGRTGHLAVMNILPLFLFSTRNNPFVSLLGVPFDTFNLFHRWVGRIVVIQSVAHTFIWGVNNYDARGLAPMWDHLSHDLFLIYGFISTVGMVVILFQSCSIVRHAFYESFLHLHQLLVIAIMAGIVLHCESQALPQKPFVYALIALWCLERFVRLCRIFYRRGTKVEVEALEGGACRVKFDVRGAWTKTPGCHVYAYIPAISLWMSHPFSVAWVDSDQDSQVINSPLSPTTTSSTHKIISSLTHDSEADFKPLPKPKTRTSVTCIVASRTGMTASLNRAVRKSRTGRLSLRAFIEGPYGGIENFRSFGTVVLFAGGVGITHQISHVRDLVGAFAEGTCATRRVVLLWSVREAEQLGWIKGWLEELHSMPKRGCELKAHMYVTRSKSLESRSITTSALSKEVGESEQVTFGRMKVDELIMNEFKARIGAMGVSVCGPGGLADDVRAGTRAVMDLGNVDFWEESLTW